MSTQQLNRGVKGLPVQGLEGFRQVIDLRGYNPFKNIAICAQIIQAAAQAGRMGHAVPKISLQSPPHGRVTVKPEGARKPDHGRFA